MASKKMAKSELLENVQYRSRATMHRSPIPLILSDQLTMADDRPWKALLSTQTFDDRSAEELENKYGNELLKVPFEDWELCNEVADPVNDRRDSMVYKVRGQRVTISGRTTTVAEVRGTVFQGMVSNNPKKTLGDVAHLLNALMIMIAFKTFFDRPGSGSNEFSPRQKEMLRQMAKQLGGDFKVWLNNRLENGLQGIPVSLDMVFSIEAVKKAWSVYYLMGYCASNQIDIVKEAQDLAAGEKKEVLDAYYKQAYPLLFQDLYGNDFIVPNAIKACRDALVGKSRSVHDKAAMALLHLTWFMADEKYAQMAYQSMLPLRLDANALRSFHLSYSMTLWPDISHDNQTDLEQAIQAYRAALWATLENPSVSHRAVQSALRSMDALNDLCADLFADGISDEHVKKALKAFYQATVACTHRQLALRVMAAIFMVVGICAIVAGTGGAGAVPIVGAFLANMSWGAQVGIMTGGVVGAGISFGMGYFSKRSPTQNLAAKVHEKAKKHHRGLGHSE